MLYIYIYIYILEGLEGVILGFGYNVVKMNGMKRVHGIQSDRLRKAIFVFRLEADAYMYVHMYYIGAYTYLLTI